MLNDPDYIYGSDAERASNAYLIAALVMVFGIPLPVLNVLAAGLFCLGSRKRPHFVRFNCLQSFVMQVFVSLVNTVVLVWTLRIVFGSLHSTDAFFGLLFTAVLFDIAMLAASLYATVRTRRKKNVRFWFFADLADVLSKPSAA